MTNNNRSGAAPSAQETVTDIIAEMRIFKCHNLETGKLELCNAIANYFADRLEAAHRREVDKLNSAIQATVGRSDAEIDRLRREVAELKRVGNAAHKRELSKIASKNEADFGQFSNEAAIREALAGLIDGICFHCDMSGDCKGVPCEKMQKARKALAKPPRNCDRFGVREEAWAAFRREYKGDYEVLEMRNMFDEWLFAPAKEGGAK